MEGCGWTHAICTAGLAGNGAADAFIKVIHLTRTRHVHQVTPAALCILQHCAYKAYLENNEDVSQLSSNAWCNHTSAEQPTFIFWSRVLQLALCIQAGRGNLKGRFS